MSILTYSVQWNRTERTGTSSFRVPRRRSWPLHSGQCPHGKPLPMGALMCARTRVTLLRPLTQTAGLGTAPASLSLALIDSTESQWLLVPQRDSEMRGEKICRRAWCWIE